VALALERCHLQVVVLILTAPANTVLFNW